MSEVRIGEIDKRLSELEELLKRSRVVTGDTDAERGERQYWQDRRDERRLLIEERNRLRPN